MTKEQTISWGQSDIIATVSFPMVEQEPILLELYYFFWEIRTK